MKLVLLLILMASPALAQVTSQKRIPVRKEQKAEAPAVAPQTLSRTFAARGRRDAALPARTAPVSFAALRWCVCVPSGYVLAVSYVLSTI